VKQKDAASTVCTVMSGGYKFSLPDLLANDAALPVANFSSRWSFAVVDTKAPFILLVISIASLIVSMITYGIAIVTTPRFTPETPLFGLRAGYLASIAALVTSMISSAKITAIMEQLAGRSDDTAWSTGGFYVWTWLVTGLMGFAVILSIVFAIKIAKLRRAPREELEAEGFSASGKAWLVDVKGHH